MGNEGGVDVSRSAIKNARSDLEDALKLLRGESKDDGGTAPPLFTTSSPVRQLLSDHEAMSGFWPAANGFQVSAANGINAVTSAYEEIVTQVENAIELFDRVLSNYDGVETGSEARSRSVQV